jgi:hypothetical protein
MTGDVFSLSLSLSLSLSQKYTIIYLSYNSESEYLKKRNKFLSIFLSKYSVF